MDKIDPLSLKDFFLSVPCETKTKAHNPSCCCSVCKEIDNCYDQVVDIFSRVNFKGDQVSNKNCCSIFSEDNFSISDRFIDDLKKGHEAGCECKLCSIVDLFSGQNQGDGPQELEIQGVIDEKSEENSCEIERFLIVQPKKQLLLTVKDGELVSTGDPDELFDEQNTVSDNGESIAETSKAALCKDETKNVEEVSTEQVHLKEIKIEEIADMCLCRPNEINAACLRHCIAYSQWKSVLLKSEGCTCTTVNECPYCERLKCLDCQHENQPSPCEKMISTDFDLEDQMNCWLDQMLSEAGVEAKFPTTSNRSNANVSTDQLHESLINSLENSLFNKWTGSGPDVHHEFQLSDHMKKEIINVDELFDVRPFPRCYKLKGTLEGNQYVGVEEEFCPLSKELWKQPWQMVEETQPLGWPEPGTDEVIEKETELRTQVAERLRRSRPPPPTVSVVALSPDWAVITKPLPQTATSNLAKEKLCQELLTEVEEECGKQYLSQGESTKWATASAALLEHGEPIPPPPPDIPLFTFQQYLDSVQCQLESSPHSDIGFKEEFWVGLESWRPDVGDTELRRRLADTASKFSSKVSELEAEVETRASSVDSRQALPDVEKALDDLIRGTGDMREVLSRVRGDLPKGRDGTARLGVTIQAGISVTSAPEPTANLPLEDVPTLLPEILPLPVQQEEEDEILVTNNEVFYDDEEENGGEQLPEGLKEKWAEELGRQEGMDDAKDATKKEDLDTLASELDQLGSPTLSNASLTPSPYCMKMRHMFEKETDGKELHPVQKFWMDRPLFPFWTPNFLYDLDDIEKTVFGNTDDVSDESDYDEAEMSAAKEEISTWIEEQTSSGNEVETMRKSDGDTKESPTNLDLPDLGELSLEKEETVVLSSARSHSTQNTGVSNVISVDQIKSGVMGRIREQREWAMELDTGDHVDLDSLVPDQATHFQFSLDTFQKQALVALEAGLNIFVLAHTSAGKTVTAEYAIGMAERNGSKVIYTSPIKALSNQKYKDFRTTFQDRISVGIITGDVQLNEKAQCLIMTTEILRSMLYNNSDVLNDLEFVILDEVHYFNDIGRGNVWEEVLILLPPRVQLVMLSATVPNPMDFANWVGGLKNRPVAVVRTLCRPVPLKFYIHVGTTKETAYHVFLIKSAEGPFLEDEFHKSDKLKQKLDDFKGKRPSSHSLWRLFVLGHLQKRGRLPAVVFAFSRRKCDELASCLNSVDLTSSPAEKQEINAFITKYISKLDPADLTINQIVTLRSTLSRGIGVHHSGILPILKEIVEILFQRGKVKLLFATETFAMGVNMPAKTVVFESVRKFDGFDHRGLKASEFTQMAGRAGRRGKDKSGTVIILNWSRSRNYIVRSPDLHNMLNGEVDEFQSKFKLRYSMILKTLSGHGEHTIDQIMSRSFYEHSVDKIKKDLLVQVSEKRKEMDSMYLVCKDLIYKESEHGLIYYYIAANEFLTQHRNIREQMLAHPTISRQLIPGKMVWIFCGEDVFSFGIILTVDSMKKNSSAEFKAVILADTGCPVPSLSDLAVEGTRSFKMNSEREYRWRFMIGCKKIIPKHSMPVHRGLKLINIQAKHIFTICNNKDNPLSGLDPREIIALLDSNRSRNHLILSELYSRLEYSFRNNSGDYFREESVVFRDKVLNGEVKIYFQLKNILLNNCTNNFNLEWFSRVFMFKELEREVHCMETRLKKEALSLQPDYESKKKLLIDREFMNDKDVVGLKGNMASRLSNYELFITEVLLSNVLSDLNCKETAALLSCLSYQDKVSKNDKNNEQQQQQHNKDGTQVNPLLKSRHKNLASAVDTTNQLPQTAVQSKFSTVKHTEVESVKNGSEVEDENEFSPMEVIPASLKNAMMVVSTIRDKLEKDEKLLDIDEGSEMHGIKFDMVPVMYDWANGKSLKSIMLGVKENVQEGLVVKWIIHLIEVIRDVESAARLMGDPAITSKLADAANSIKRGIVFTPSLYLQQDLV